MQVKTFTLPKSETYVNIILPSIAFFLPFIFSGPQLITGSVVNCLLIIASFKYSKAIWPVIVLPSVAALLHGVVFGQFTPFLVFFLPWIWLGNFILVTSFIYFKKLVSYPLALFFSSIIKAVALYSFALIYFHLSLIPKLFLSSMGLFQFITAILGGTLAYILFRFIKSDE